MPANKTDVVDCMAEQAEISKAAAAKALKAFIDFVTVSLKNKKSVSLLGFGTFDVKERSARTGRNPRTGEAIEISASNVPSFKAGKVLKDAVNSRSE